MEKLSQFGAHLASYIRHIS